MADSVVRLRIDSSEYDNKLRNATTALNRFFDSARQGGQSIANADKSVEDAVRSFGNMAAKAQDARGKLNEMTRAFTEMSMQYKQLTDAEKQSPVGQAIAKSLDQLKGRINETKGQLAEVNKELGNTKTESNAASGSLGSLTQVLGGSIGKFASYAAAIEATKVALDVLKDAFFTSETNVDDWGRTVEGAKAVYESFLISLNNGDFSNFFNNLDQVVNKAQSAYNALDNLKTVMTIINPERAKLQTEQQRLRGIIRREGANSQAGKDASRQLKAMEPALTAAYEKESEMNYDAFKAAVDARLAEAGLNLNKKSYDLLMKSFSDTATYELLKKNATGNVREIWKSARGAGSYRTTEDTRNTNQKLLDLFTDEWRNQFSPYLTASYSAQGQAYGVLLRNARYLNGGRGGGGGGGKTTRAVVTKTGEVLPEGSVAAYEKEIQELRKAQSYATDTETWKAYAEQIAMVTYEVKKLKGELADVKTPEQAMADYQSGSISSAQDFAKGFRSTMLDDFRQQAKETADEQQDAAKKTADAWSAVGNSINAVSGALAGLEDPTAQVVGLVAQAIATIALTFAKSLKGTITPWDWIAAAASGVSTMVSVISAIKSATAGSYAQGGIVPGNNHSDGLLAAVSSGELILNASQQNNIASLLQGGGLSNMHLEAVVSGEQLRFVLNNNSRRRSRGEYVTTLMRN